MGNLRSLRKSIAKHPVNVWRAKTKAAKQAEEAAKAKEAAFSITPEDIEKIKETVPSGLVFQNPPSTSI